MRVIADHKGAMESLTGPDEPPPAEIASETFGARIMRELLATLPTLLRIKNGDSRLADVIAAPELVTAIADARERGMHELAAKLEQKLLGTPLETPKVTMAEVVDDSYEHGFLEGSMQDNFDRGTVNGHMARDLRTASPAYREGFEAGRTRRLSMGAAMPALSDGSNGQPQTAPALSSAVEPDSHSQNGVLP